MRKLIVCNLMSLDGYFEAPNHNVMPLFQYRETHPLDDAFDRYNAERLRAASTLLLGRASFDGFKSYWPAVVDDPAADPVSREISRLDNAIDKVVVSDTLTPGDVAPWHNTRIIPRAKAYQQVAALKQEPGRDILTFGSRALWSDLLAHALVDELHLMIAPVVLGGGTPIFQGLPGVPLRLIDASTWPGSALVLARYDARRPA